MGRVVIALLALAVSATAGDLFRAVSAGDRRSVQKFLKRGATAKMLATRDRQGRMPLHLAVKSGDAAIVELLLAGGADVHATTRLGKTPLHIAAERGSAKLIKLFLAKGARVNATDLQKRTPLTFAPTANVIKMLIAAGARVDVVDKNGNTPIHHFARDGHWNHGKRFKLIAELGVSVNSANKRGYTALHWAASAYHVKAAGALLRLQADPNLKDRGQETPMHVLLDRGHSKDAMTRRAALLKLLASRGADLGSKDRYGFTPLHRAAYWGPPELVALLVRYGAYPKSTDNRGRTPADICRTSDHNTARKATLAALKQKR